jgi:hypothetical protein
MNNLFSLKEEINEIMKKRRNKILLFTGGSICEKGKERICDKVFNLWKIGIFG